MSLPLAIFLCFAVAVAVATIMELRMDGLRLQLRRAESDRRLALELLRIQHRYTLRRLKNRYRHVVHLTKIRHRFVQAADPAGPATETIAVPVNGNAAVAGLLVALLLSSARDSSGRRLLRMDLRRPVTPVASSPAGVTPPPPSPPTQEPV